MEQLLRVTDALKSIRVRPTPPAGGTTYANDDRALFWLVRSDGTQETRLSALRAPAEFLDYQRVSRPADLSTATSVRQRVFRRARAWSDAWDMRVADHV